MVTDSEQTASCTAGGRVLVLIPAYNEAAHIAGVVERALQTGYPVLVIDDGSEDATAPLAAEAGARVLTHPCNLGLTAVLQTGYTFALGQGYEAVVQVDGDGQHECADIPSLLAPVLEDRADMVIGSRFLNGGDYAMPVLRKFGRNVFRAWLAAAGLHVTDPTSGFQALNRNMLQLCLSKHFPDDYPDANMLLLALRSGLRIEERPARMYRNSEGKSMHNGLLKPLVYVVSMTLSLCMLEVRSRLERWNGRRS